MNTILEPVRIPWSGFIVNDIRVDSGLYGLLSLSMKFLGSK